MNDSIFKAVVDCYELYGLIGSSLLASRRNEYEYSVDES